MLEVEVLRDIREVLKELNTNIAQLVHEVEDLKITQQQRSIEYSFFMNRGNL